MDDKHAQRIKDFFKRDTFAEHCGVELLEVGEGTARAKLVVQDYHLNGLGMCHGGAIFALADLVFAVAGNSHGTVAMAININISYMKAARKGDTLYAEGFENTKNPKLGNYTINVTDDKGELIAVFQGMVYRKKDSIDDYMH